jgi:hypothetical protein
LTTHSRAAPFPSLMREGNGLELEIP